MAVALVIFICATILFLILWIREKNKSARKLPPNHTQAQYQQQWSQYMQSQQPLDPYTGQPYSQQGQPYSQQPPAYQQGQRNPNYRPPSYPAQQSDYALPVSSQPPAQDFAQPMQPAQQPQYAASQPLDPYAQGPYYPPPQMTVKPALTKEQIHLRNLNIILFIASFLVLAGAAVIIGSMSNSSARLIILLAITAVFYLSGIVIHVITERLQPAALALTSTGLALIPFTGIAFYYFANLPGPTAWLIMSIIGLIANIIATYVLRNQVVTYVAIAFVFSLLCSLVATMSIGLVWYFVVLIFISMICSLISLLKPTLLPEILIKPIERTGQIVTPAAVICSSFVIDYATAPLYSTVFTMAAVHYLIEFIKSKKPLAEILLRALAQAAIICIVSDIFSITPSSHYTQPVTHSLILTFTIFISAVLQMIYSLIKLKRNRELPSFTKQLPWMLCASLVALISLLALYPVGIEAYGPLSACIVFAFVGLYHGYVAIFCRKSGLAYISLACSLVVISVIFTEFVVSLHSSYIASWIFLALAFCFVFYLRKQKGLRSVSVYIFLIITAITYIIFAILFAEVTLHTTPVNDFILNWRTAFVAIVIIISALLIYWISVIENKIAYMIASCALLYLAIYAIAYENAPLYYDPVCMAIAGAVIFGVASIIYHRRKELLRRNTAFIAASVSSLILLQYLQPPQPEFLPVFTGMIVAAIVALFAAVTGLLFGKTDVLFKRIAVTCSLSLCFVSALIATQANAVLSAIVFLYLAVLAYLFADRLRIQWLVLLSIPSLMVALFFVPMYFAKSYLSAFFVFGTTAAVSYILHWINQRFSPENKFRTNTLFVFTLVYLLFTAFVPESLGSPFDFVSATALLALGVVIFVRGYNNETEKVLKELGLYICAGAAVWYLLFFSDSIYNGFFAIHIVAAFVWIFAAGLPKESKGRSNRFAVAATILAIGTGITAIHSASVSIAGDWISFALFLYFAALIYLFSIQFRVPWLLLLSIPSLMGALFFIQWNTANGAFRPELFVFVNTAVVAYFLYMINLRLRPVEKTRTIILYWYSILYLLLAAIVPAIFGQATESIWPEVASATALIAMGVLLWIRGQFNDREKFLKECGLYVGACAIIWFALIFVPGSFDISIGAFVSAAAVIVSAILLQNEGRGRSNRLVIAMSIITIGTIAEAISSELLFFQILFLAEMIAILVIGALRNKQWMIYWGCFGTIIAILYYLRNYTWMMLIFLGLILIAFVIWRLMKLSKKKG